MGSGGIDLDISDSSRTYTEAEEHRLTENLVSLLGNVHGGAYSSRTLCLELVCELHEQIFTGVRDFAGQYRSKGRGSERLRFGQNWSETRDRVQELMEISLRRAQVDRGELLQGPPNARLRRGFELAVLLHAEVVRIHPFEDGNGRTSRALLSVVLMSLGIPPMPAEIPKQEYIDCLNVYHTTRSIDLLRDLLLAAHPLCNQAPGQP